MTSGSDERGSGSETHHKKSHSGKTFAFDEKESDESGSESDESGSEKPKKKPKKTHGRKSWQTQSGRNRTSAFIDDMAEGDDDVEDEFDEEGDSDEWFNSNIFLRCSMIWKTESSFLIFPDDLNQ